MDGPRDIQWWVDTTGGFHTSEPDPGDPAAVYAAGSVDPDARNGAITVFRGRPATIATLPHELIDLLEHRFPGTRWSVPDPAPKPQHADTR